MFFFINLAQSSIFHMIFSRWHGALMNRLPANVGTKTPLFEYSSNHHEGKFNYVLFKQRNTGSDFALGLSRGAGPFCAEQFPAGTGTEARISATGRIKWTHTIRRCRWSSIQNRRDGVPLGMIGCRMKVIKMTKESRRIGASLWKLKLNAPRTSFQSIRLWKLGLLRSWRIVRRWASNENYCSWS